MPEFSASCRAKGPAPRLLPALPARLWLLCMACFLWIFCLSPTPVHAERVALVVGNSSYQNVAPLPNPRNDAEAMARDLEAIITELDKGELDPPRLTHLQDRVGVLAERVQWVPFEQQREALEETIKGLWARLEVVT